MIINLGSINDYFLSERLIVLPFLLFLWYQKNIVFFFLKSKLYTFRKEPENEQPPQNDDQS